MKRYLAFILACMICFAAKGQRYMKRYDNDVYPITFGLMGGGTIAALRITADAVSPQQIKFTGSFGVNVDFRMSDNFSLRPGIMYAGKGGVASGTYTDPTTALSVPVSNDYNLNYLEVPLNLLVHVPLNNDDANIYFGGGPFIAYGLNGKNNQSVANVTQKQNVYFGANGDFNKADYGATAVIGFQAGNGFSVSANADFGLKNILLTNNTGYNVTGVKTLMFYLTLGQSF